MKDYTTVIKPQGTFTHITKTKRTKSFTHSKYAAVQSTEGIERERQEIINTIIQSLGSTNFVGMQWDNVPNSALLAIYNLIIPKDGQGTMPPQKTKH